MNRKGFQVAHEAPIRAIIVIAAIGLLFFFAVKFGFIFNEDKEKNICSATLAIQASTHAGPDVLQIDSPLRTYCKRSMLKVEEKQLVLNRPNALDKPMNVYIDGKPVDKYPALNQKVMDSILADSMKRCWERGLEGEKPLFNTKEFVGSPTTCLICEEIHVEADVQAGGDPLTKYLTDTKVPGKDITYEQFLFTSKRLGATDLLRSGDRQCVKDLEIPENPVITKGTYASVLFRSNSQFWPGCQATYIMSGEDIARVCRYPAN